MSQPLLVRNVITIAASPQKVWDALVNPAQTRRYMFGCETVSDWKAGSPLLWQGNFEGVDLVAVKGFIKAIRPAEYLAYTVFDPNIGMEDIPENYLTVTYELSEKDGQTVLTVTQSGFETVADGARRFKEASNDGHGWEPILIEIKKLVESA
ncbi:MAG: SRPBCC domain-containing protein [Bacteroidota bacterium]|nr:SRPBCC domain-containing protein [Bacteroidota bacterium]MDP4215482.1 SRPBCC domain-containing protein [Bacteroidota bacterium]MDP4246724.1 SRPBCC domain-containing protein [Bacteroidota bacterium]MDP4252561.1 SRPBCC domain-containing protein [Bacteroidota bacterium]MDP4257803.1 SRPBCC domain-containing protein [Bacteroidota bacterium]